MKYCLSLFIFMILSVFLYQQIPAPHAHYDIDSYGYQEQALLFFDKDNMHDRAPVQPIGYPFFLGCLYRVFGQSLLIVVIVQVLLMVISILLLIKTTALLFDPFIAYISGLVAAINLGFLVYPQFILAETLLLFLLMLFFYCFTVFYVQTKKQCLYLSGFILGLSTIVKPTALFLPIILVPIIVYKMRGNSDRVLSSVMSFVLFFIAPIFAYMAYNYYLYGYFSFAPMMPLNLYQCLLAKVMHIVEHIPVQQIIDEQLRFTEINAFNPEGWSKARMLFYHYLYNYPSVFVSVWFCNVIKTLCGLFSTQLKVLIEPGVQGGDCSFFACKGPIFERMYTYSMYGITHSWLIGVVFYEVIWSIVRLFLVVIGCGLLVFEKKYGLVCIFVLCIMLFSGVTGMDGCCRYRVVFEPLLIMLSAYTVAAWYRCGVKKVRGI